MQATPAPSRTCRRVAVPGPVIAVLLAVLALGGCAGPASIPFDAQTRTATFDRYWSTLDRQYPFLTSKGIDWDHVRSTYRPLAASATSRAEFYHALARMLTRLDDPHVTLDVSLQDLCAPGEPCTSLGLSLVTLERRLFVLRWPRGTVVLPPPGVDRRLPELLAIDGTRADLHMSSILLAGPAGSPVVLTLRWADGSVSDVRVFRPDAPPPARGPPLVATHRPAPVGPAPPVSPARPSWLAWHRAGDLGYLRVSTFSVKDSGLESAGAMIAALDTALDDLADTRGLILDLQDNGGGDSYVAQQFVRRFLAAPTLGGIVRFRFLDLLPVRHRLTLRPRLPRYDGGVAVLLSGLSGSVSEHVALILRRANRATLVGQRTIGAEAGVVDVPGPDGSTLTFGRYRVVDESGRGLQDVGVVPDLEVPLTLADVRDHGLLGAVLGVRIERLERAVAALGSDLDIATVGGVEVSFPMISTRLRGAMPTTGIVRTARRGTGGPAGTGINAVK